MLTVRSEPKYSEDHFERKFQAKISPYDQILFKPEEELIDIKEEHQDELRKFSSVPIQSEVITLTSEHPSSEDYSENNFEDKISPSEKSLDKPEE